MKYYIIAGEASGDLHGSNLIKAIKEKAPGASFRAWGGDMMKEQGADLVKHINQLAFMGFAEVLMNLRTILANIKYCKNDIINYQPDAVIFIDYPGFNLRIAEFCKQHNIKTIYYVSPQVWAWNSSRVKKIKRDIDKMLVILPFEKDFYNRYNYHVEFVGHPLLDAIPEKIEEKEPASFIQKHNLAPKPIIALLPGSRKQEISKMLYTMTRVAANFPQYQFVIAGTKAHSPDFYRKYSADPTIPVLTGHTYTLLQNAHAALVTSGTATLETAIIGTPQVVCYKANLLSYHIAKKLVDIKYISLVNLIMDKQVVKEMIQTDFNTAALTIELKKITNQGESRKNILDNYAKLHSKLGGSGASDRAALQILNMMNSKKTTE